MPDRPPTTPASPTDLDLVELAAIGPLTGLTPVGVLVDEEGTPVAAVGDDGVTALRPLAPRPALDEVTLGPGDVALSRCGAVVLFDALPTRAQVVGLDRLAESAPIGWVALTGRGRAAGSTDAGRLLGAVGAAAQAWSVRTGRQAPVAALPWALTAESGALGTPPELADADALAAWVTAVTGVPETVVLGEGDEHRALAALEDDAAGAARALYPAEVLAFHAGERRRGGVVLFTGYSGSGKSTIANAVTARLADAGVAVSLLDGDAVRRLLSAGLGFDAESRALNVRRIGWVAGEIAKAGGTAVAAPIAPFAAGRAEVRRFAEDAGARFVLVHVSTPLEECERRDRKGLYAAARRGEVADFTGVSSPYEVPDDADVVVDTTSVSVDEAAQRVLDALDGVAS